MMMHVMNIRSSFARLLPPTEDGNMSAVPSHLHTPGGSVASPQSGQLVFPP